MPKIYISPSTQETNKGATPFSTEEIEMNKITDKLMPLLLNDGRFLTRRNTPDMTPYQCAEESNKFGADIHVAIHSNAGGGVGTEVFAYAPGTNSERLSKCLYNQIAPLSPGADRGVKYNKRLVEVGDSVNATASLIELGFHDNAKDAKWLVDDRGIIAVALYKGICDYYGYEYRYLTIEPSLPPSNQPLSDPDVNLVVWVRGSKVSEAIRDINGLGFYAEQFPLKLRRD